MKWKTIAPIVFFTLPVIGFALPRGISENPQANNKALLVGVSQGLPGLGIDIDNMKRVLGGATTGFTSTVLRENEGNVANIKKHLTSLSDSVDSRGSFLFYFTGHGARNVILAQDRTMNISEIRSALEEGRATWGPMRRLILFFDSCHSGSLLDPLFARLRVPPLGPPEYESKRMADEIYSVFSNENKRDAYWMELFVFASAGANETCEASGSGSAFTNALTAAFDQTVGKKSVADFISMTKEKTKGSHPTERLVPTALSALSM